jgi:hypothetical protein
MRVPETFRSHLQNLRERRTELAGVQAGSGSNLELRVERARQARRRLGHDHSRNRQHLPKV